MEYLQYNLLTTMVKLNRLVVLNLIINGIPSIQTSLEILNTKVEVKVLNLIINGIPSIL